MQEYIVRYEVRGVELSARVSAEYGIAKALEGLKDIEPNATIRYIIRVKEYSNGFDIDMFQRGGWEDLLK